uniref:Ion transport domain-containing protein n=1 Tax=Naja naja TaxID=35670 RepID=A0A8C6VDQ2_NAJNA
MMKSPLEMDDGIGEDLNAAVKGAAEEEYGQPPLETPFQEEAPPPSLIWMNLNHNPDLVRDRIFEAVVAGDPELLIGLSDYLRRTSSFLTNSEYRDGETDKTCLMKALLSLKDGKNPTIPVLLRIDKETENPEPLVNIACTDSYYKGQTALHIAIEKRKYEFVKLLVENGADVHAKASGLLFQKGYKEAHFYFGELPLSLAACTNQPEVVRYLLDNPHNKAEVTEQDSMGNTVLHALVMVANDTEKNTELVVNMYDMILMKGAEMDPAPNLEVIKNGEELTPLTLAVKTGKVKILKHMLQREIKDPKFQRKLSRKLIEWTYGPIQTSIYDLSSIDSCEENSALEILAYNSDVPNRYEMLALEPLNKLLQHKWKYSIKQWFCFSFVFHCAFMVIFTATAYNWPPKDEPLVPTPVTFPILARLFGAVVILIGGVYFFVAQSVYFWRRRHSLKGLLMDSCFDILLFVQALAILASSMMFLANTETYVLPMVFALLLGWVNMLYYTRGCQQTGICLVMIQKVILKDLWHFLMLYGILLVGFATALIVLTGGAPHSAHNTSVPLSDDSEDQAVYSGLLRTALLLFRFTIGMGDLEYNKNVKHSYVAMLLVLLFVILTYILLLNMLIALMSETVTDVSKYSQSVWQLQRAIAILQIEKNRIWSCKKAQGDSRFIPIESEDKKEQRWFFRVEEVNWEDWTEKLVLTEEPRFWKSHQVEETMFLDKSSGKNGTTAVSGVGIHTSL